MKYVLLFAVVMTAAAQDFPRNSLSVGAAVADPGGDLLRYLPKRPAVSIGYGYRFHRNIQADIGLDTVFGTATAGDNEFGTRYGITDISDHLFLAPFGGRGILPLKDDRILLSLGGGGAYARYQISDWPATSGFCGLGCMPRNEWGAYGLLNASYAVTRSGRFRVGATAKHYWLFHTFPNIARQDLPGIGLQGHWTVVSGEFSYHF